MMMDTLTDLTMWNLIIGFAAPLLISVVQRPGWSDGLRTTVTFVFCVIVGAGSSYFAGLFDGKTIISSVLLVLVTAIATYKGLWKTSGIAPKIEAATTPGNQRVVQAVVSEPKAVPDPTKEGGRADALFLLVVAIFVVVLLLFFGVHVSLG